MPITATASATTRAASSTTTPDATPLEIRLTDGMRADAMIQQVRDIGGPRAAGTPQAKRAAELIRDAAAANGWDAVVEHVAPNPKFGGIDLYNVVANRPGTGAEGTRGLVLAGAHLDSVPGVFGANDDASGAAALLEATRVFSQNPTKENLRFVWFDGEEAGLLGSRAYVDRHKEELRGAKGMIVAEMLGSPNGTPQIVFTDKASSVAAKPVLEAAARSGITPKIEIDPRAGSDHLPFAHIGVPSLVVASAVPRTIDHDDPNYHRAGDTPDKLNPKVYETAGDLFALAVSAYANPE